MKYDNESQMVSLSELCAMLSISTATGRNWIKLEKIVPQTIVKKAPYFSLEYVNQVKDSLQKGENAALKSRRNKNISPEATYTIHMYRSILLRRNMYSPFWIISKKAI